LALSLQQPTGTWTNGFGWDLAGRLTNVTSAAGAFGYTYTNLDASFSGRLVQHLSLPNGAYATNLYDPVARLLDTVLKSSAGTTLDAAYYGYNVANQRTAYTNGYRITHYLYNYDPAGQLTVSTSSTASEDRGYAYDAAWNLKYLTNNGALSTFIVDNKNELTNAFTAANGYDSNGNLTAGDNGHNAYVYDDENRLIQWFWYATDSSHLTNGALRTDFYYDGIGRLRERLEFDIVGSSGGGGTGPQQQQPPPWTFQYGVLYLYDGWRVIQERDTNNTPLVSYTRGLDLSGSLEGAGGIGGLLARSSGYSSGSWTSHAYYHADGNGNITTLIDGSQSVVANYRYDPFGNTLLQSGTLADANVYRFSSKEVHTNSAMYYYGYRFYDPELQRWINRDPYADMSSLAALGPDTEPQRVSIADVLNTLSPKPFEMRDGPNIQAFLFNQALSLVDPWGLDCWDDFENCMNPSTICAGAIGGVAGAVGTAVGGFAGAGPHRGPKGYPRPVIRGGRPTGYGKGLGRSIGGSFIGGAAVGVLALSAKCYAALLGCLTAPSGVAPWPPPPYSGGTVNTPPVIVSYF
jgi:RHS repeat-associated protein